MEKYCITLEQAKKLYDIGITERFEDAQYHWYSVESIDKGEIICFDRIPSWLDHRPYKAYPAYHVGELGEILPFSIENHSFYSYKICDDLWEVGFSWYSSFKFSCNGTTEAQARGELLIYLVTNNLL